MSVILRDMSTNEIFLYCKGAETAIFSKCAKESSRNCNSILKRFASQGFRTLTFAYKLISEECYASIERLLSEAYNDIVLRDEKLEKANEIIENDLKLVGASAVEDKLQEDVAKVLQELSLAGIKIWVLTGDKTETGFIHI